MGKAVAVYVREADLALWERVERYAAERRMAVSQVVLLACERLLSEQERRSND